jgi:WXXGXW repeat (2 copies)
MKRTRLISPLLFATLATATSLGGCVVRGSVAVPAPAIYVGAVSVAPPAPRVEVIGTPPQPGYVWLGGYWNWAGGRHVWVAGHWEARHPGYHWVPHEWVAAEGGWRLREGHWARG